MVLFRAGVCACRFVYIYIYISLSLYIYTVLLKEHSHSMRRFRNVPRHNGFQAWLVMTAPINEDKVEVRRELLGAVINPPPASSVEGLEKAMDDWKTNKRLLTEADGKLPDAETMRLAFVAMLWHEVYTYVSLHMDMEEYGSVGKLEHLDEVCEASDVSAQASSGTYC